MSYIEAKDLVYTNKDGIYSGGFNVQSIMMKGGISPIMTINNNDGYMNYLYKLINNKNNLGLPVEEIPPNQQSVAGGFFIIHKDKIDWWSKTYDSKLVLYFKHNYLVKDDQIIIIDCVLSQLSEFVLFREDNVMFDNWFMFQRILF